MVLKSIETEFDYRPRITYQYGNVFKYTNYYDNSMSDKVELVLEATEAANTVFYNQFGMHFYTYGSPVYRGDFTDACSTGGGNLCSYACPENAHHKDIWRISTLLNEEIEEDNERIVFWTDQPHGTYCSHELGYCLPVDVEDPFKSKVAVVAIPGNPVIHLLNIIPDYGSSEQNEACMGLSLIHETAHTFGLDERYDDYNHDNPEVQCVMKRYDTSGTETVQFYYAIKSNTNAFCEDCASDLSAEI